MGREGASGSDVAVSRRPAGALAGTARDDANRGAVPDASRAAALLARGEECLAIPRLRARHVDALRRDRPLGQFRVEAFQHGRDDVIARLRCKLHDRTRGAVRNIRLRAE
eukprot:10773452-Alexandrium_andersonii.AAC.1